MVRINSSIYYHFENFIQNENLNHILSWYVQEPMFNETNGIFHWLLYISLSTPQNLRHPIDNLLTSTDRIGLIRFSMMAIRYLGLQAKHYKAMLFLDSLIKDLNPNIPESHLAGMIL